MDESVVPAGQGTDVGAMLAPCARALAESLVDDPFYRTITASCGRDEAARLDMLARYFGVSIQEGLSVGQVHLAGATGAAIWITAGNGPRADAAREHKLEALATVLGPIGFAHYQNLVANMEQQLPATVKADAWYLSILGVEAGKRGRGLGGRLLAPTLREADAFSRHCFLETFNPRSIPFYERLGFVTLETLTEPLTTATYHIMLRAPKRASLAA